MATMNYGLLGRSGLRVADLALGTMTFGASSAWGVPAEDAARIYTAYREAGGNYLDTANQYAVGESERLIGQFVAGHREEVVIATKFSNSPPRQDANAGGNHRKNMVQSVEASLRRLGTDYVDLYLVHSWDMITPVEEVMRAFDDLVRSGKVLHVGVSNTPAWVVAKANVLAEMRGWSPYVGLQVEYSLLARTVERDLVPMAQDQRMSVLAWSPLKNGMLTGKYLGVPAEGSRLTHDAFRKLAGWNDPSQEWSNEVLRVVLELAAELEVTPAQLALAWLRHRPVHVVPVVGASTVAQLKDNLGSLDVTLTAEQVDRLDKVSDVPAGYPHEYLASPMSRSFRSAGMHDRIRA